MCGRCHSGLVCIAELHRAETQLEIVKLAAMMLTTADPDEANLILHYVS